MGDDKNGEEPSRVVVTSAKKLYGTIKELSLQLQNLSSRSLDIEDLFAPELQAKRFAIKDCCEQLFNLSPEAYGAVARENLWRLALYDGVAKARKIQRDRKWTPLQLDLVKAHLQSGVGVLKLYLMKLKGLCESTTDPLIVRMDSVEKWLEDGTTNSTEIITHGELERTWITDLAYLCTINIGDLYRYLKDIHAKANDEEFILEAAFYETGAQAHYAQAFLLRPDSGLAFNQLGNLYCDVNGALQSAYYLLYSVQSANAYEGAYSNLRQLLDRKIVQYARLPASVEPKPIDTLVHNVLSLLNYLLFEHTHLQNCERFCQEALTNFTERLIACDPEMDERFLFHLSSLCVMVVWRLQVTNSDHISSAVAFSISIFCQLIIHLTGILEQHARLQQIISAPPTPSPAPSEPEIDQTSDITSSKTNESDEDQEDEEESTPRDVFVVPKRRKRIRAGRSDSDSGSEMSDTEKPGFLGFGEEELENTDESESDWSCEEDEDCNESDDDFDGRGSFHDGSEYSFKMEKNKAFADSSSSNGNSVSSGSSSKDKDLTLQTKAVEGENGRRALLENEEEGKFVIELEDLEKCRSRLESILAALSPFLRWIQATPVIKDALAANAEKSLLEKFCTTLNLLISQDWTTLLANDISLPGLSEDWNKLCSGEKLNEKLVFKWELEEDRSMLGIPQLQDFVNHLQLKSVTSNDSLIIRFGRMVAFGSWMVSTESFSMLYNSDEKRFFVPTPQTLKSYLLGEKLKRLKEKMNHASLDDMDNLSKAYKTMKLIHEEKEKERRSSRARRNSSGDAQPSSDRRRRRGRRGTGCRKGAVHAVIDLEAVLKCFGALKRIAAHRKFVIVIPNSVWKTLDMLKDSTEADSDEAQVAFRWIDAALKRNHPGVTLQKEPQKLKIDFPYPRDHLDVDAWEYYDIMEYCNFLNQIQLKEERARSRSRPKRVTIWGDVRDKCQVFYLTGREDLLNTKIPRGFDPVKIARNVGIYVDYIKPYPGLDRGKKWQSVAKSNG